MPLPMPRCFFQETVDFIKHISKTLRLSRNISRRSRMSLLNSLIDVLGKDSVSASKTDLISYSRDNLPLTLFHQRQNKIMNLPDAIVWPNNYDDVVKILKFANEKKIPIVPYGAGSGVCGGTVALKGGIIIDLKRLDKIIAFDEKSLFVNAQSD